MDRAVILGTFEFVGFSLCKFLLDQGCMIDGIHINNGEEEPYLNEKRLEIGRNANFYEMNYSEWLETTKEIQEDSVLFIDFYDLYIKNNLFSLRENELIEKYFINNLNELKKYRSKIVFLFPLQWQKDINRAHSRCETAIELLKENNIVVYSFYLPAVYGPWQPEEFIFHQALADRKRTVLSNREWNHDAIFIDDLIHSIIEEADQMQGGAYLLKSSLPGHWQKCAEYLSLEYSKNHRYDDLGKGKIIEKTVKNSVNFSEGLEKQRRHLNTLLNRNGY
ncbi:hypothetical protein J7I93_12640 [Bacillus sp. ISL-47]|uniref:hypothetical protein n=1 Tax=Bacillus sp. ISL-47 TaxID=2819130 RepID=UPI001BEAC47F|nr:hypothetical protein [Bacillus sp. ISL-47]MBT2689033.1 hypothetical protein [Bacillus sp. ISL-47]MBT2708687.1 hypothetical protein [Pseudomonas sp. ISL-84]